MSYQSRGTRSCTDSPRPSFTYQFNQKGSNDLNEFVLVLGHRVHLDIPRAKSKADEKLSKLGNGMEISLCEKKGRWTHENSPSYPPDTYLIDDMLNDTQ